MSSAPSTTTRGLRLYLRTSFGPSWLAEVMVPLARALRADHGATVTYLGRGWKHGPHVDLIAYGPAELPWAELAARTDWRLDQLGPELSEADYLAQAGELGRLERVAPPYMPLHERGTVKFLDGRRHLYLPQALDTLADNVLTRLFEPLARTAESRTDVAEAFAALLTAHPWGPQYGVFSFRSHSEAFFNWVQATGDRRPAFQARLRREAATLRPLVERIRDGGESATAAAWRSAFGYALGHLDAAVSTGQLTPAMLDNISQPDNNAGMGPPGAPNATPRRSDFHRTVAESRVADQPPGWFASYRLLINLFYGQLPLLGISPIERFYLCFAVAETVDDVYGETWRDRLQRVAERSRR